MARNARVSGMSRNAFAYVARRASRVCCAMFARRSRSRIASRSCGAMYASNAIDACCIALALSSFGMA